MRIVSRIVAILGLVALLAGIGLMVHPLIDIWTQTQTIQNLKSATVANPMPEVLLSAAVLTLGGFLIGLGIIPRGAKKPEHPVDKG